MVIDRESEKPFDRISGLDYIMGHNGALNQFLSRFRKADQSMISYMFAQMDPAILATILRSNYESTGSLKEEELIRKVSIEGTFSIMLGLPGAGKTGSGTWLTELLLARGYNVYWFGYSPALEKAYPKVVQTFDLKNIENGVLFYDEVLLTLFGRSAMNKEVKERVLNFPYIRHHGVAVVMMSQTEQFDVTLRNLITYIWFKPFVISSMFERNLHFKPYVRYLIPQEKTDNLLYNISTNECMIFKNPLPTRWSDELSKAFAPLKDLDDAKRYAKMLQQAGVSDRELPMFLSQRNVKLEDVASELNLLSCPKCGSTYLTRWGRRGINQRWKCSGCEHVFDEK